MKFIPALAFSLISYIGHGQSVFPYVINSTGNVFTRGGYSTEYSVGEIAAATIGEGDFNITKGVLLSAFTAVISNPVKLDVFGPKYIFDRLNSDLHLLCSEEISSIEVFDSKGNKVSSAANTAYINLRQLNDSLYLVFCKDYKESFNYFKFAK